MVMKPSSVAAISLACSTYTLKQFPSPCGSFPFLDKIGALLIIALVTYINLTSVVLTNKMLVCLTFSKVVALIIVVLMGIVNLFRGFFFIYSMFYTIKEINMVFIEQRLYYEF